MLFDYEPENEDELKIEVGDTVEIIKQVTKVHRDLINDLKKMAMILKKLKYFLKIM